ncbi:MAG: hypothetical protein ACWA5A_17505, partial [Marinibacterium sp.]
MADPATLPYRFVRRGRSRRNIAALALAWAGLAGLALAFDAAPWLVGLIGLATLPLIWEIAADPVSFLEMTETGLTWQSGAARGKAVWPDIARADFHTRWDFSVMVTLIGKDGSRIRLPPGCLPPHR